eukprot:CAMPEP_0197026660 /NCGR_PEP_ID=MMETSP1384-20130603/6704_1 /TAXON_ID=29189 /ORGANISM="Ammonia sp." /LENGTH=301 /DNA_ID=CAMNT_0042455363 /DNA_START=192 /DNA_END=1097 /DNA_ORIENTATION=-
MTRCYSLHRTQQRQHTSPSSYFIDEQTRTNTIDEIKQQRAEITQKYPNFMTALNAYFPGSLLMSEFFFLAHDATTNLGFTDENTIGLAAVCRDGITDGCMDEIIKYYGKPFNCSSLAGFVTIGNTGLASAMTDVPIDPKDGKRRFVFVAMPHIAVSEDGKIGHCKRNGVNKEGNVCSILDGISSELQSGKLNVELNRKDVEQSLVRQRVLAELSYGERPQLEELTKVASDIIAKDVDDLLTRNLDLKAYSYVVITGIQIHGPDDIDWVFPNKLWHVSNHYVGSNDRTHVTLKDINSLSSGK